MSTSLVPRDIHTVYQYVSVAREACGSSVEMWSFYQITSDQQDLAPNRDILVDYCLPVWYTTVYQYVSIADQ